MICMRRIISQGSMLKSYFCTRSIDGVKKYSERITKARNILTLYNLRPQAIGDVFIAPNATIAGDVFLGNNISIWHGTVIRGDINQVKIHANVSIGDNCVLHTAGSLPSGLPAALQLWGDNVVQSGCTLYSCTLRRKAFVGYNSVIMEGAVLDEGAIVAPNSVVPPGRLIPAYQVWGGNPIKFIRHARQQTGYVTINIAQTQMQLGRLYAYQFLPYSNAYLFRQNTPQEQKIKFYDYEDARVIEMMSSRYDPTTSTIV